MSQEFVCVLVLSVLLGMSWSYPTGAPTAACVDMTPQHFVPPQSTSNPYKLIVANNGDGTFSGSLEKTDSSVPDFKGFLIQARPQNSTVPVGFFDLFATGSKALSCYVSADGVTHDSNIFRTSVPFTWVAPAEGVNGVRFVATVCQAQIVFWLGLESLDLGTIIP